MPPCASQCSSPTRASARDGTWPWPASSSIAASRCLSRLRLSQIWCVLLPLSFPTLASQLNPPQAPAQPPSPRSTPTHPCPSFSLRLTPRCRSLRPPATLLRSRSPPAPAPPPLSPPSRYHPRQVRAFCTVPHDPYGPLAFRHECQPYLLWFWLNFIVDVYFVIDIVINFRTGFMHEGHFVNDDWMVMSAYLKQSFIMDVAGTIPLGIIQMLGNPDNPFGDEQITQMQIAAAEQAEGGGSSSSAQSARMLRLLRLAKLTKLARMRKLAKVVESFEEYINPGVLAVSKLVFISLFCCHLFGCLWWMISDLEIAEELAGTMTPDSWFSTPYTSGPNEWHPPHWLKNEASLTMKYMHAFFWGAGMVTSLVPREVNPVTVVEYLVTCAVMFFGLMLNAYVISSLSQAMAAMNAKAEFTGKQMESIKSYLTIKQVPKALKGRIMEYYHYLYGSNMALENLDLFRQLPPALVMQLNLATNRRLAMTCAFFHKISNESLVALLNHFTAVVFIPSQLIAKQGTLLHAAYFISRGIVQVSTHDSPTHSTLTNTESLGLNDYWAGCIAHAPPQSSHSTHAITYCDVMCLEVEHIQRTLATDKAFKLALAEARRTAKAAAAATRLAMQRRKLQGKVLSIMFGKKSKKLKGTAGRNGPSPPGSPHSSRQSWAIAMWPSIRKLLWMKKWEEKTMASHVPRSGSRDEIVAVTSRLAERLRVGVRVDALGRASPTFGRVESQTSRLRAVLLRAAARHEGLKGVGGGSSGGGGGGSSGGSGGSRGVLPTVARRTGSSMVTGADGTGADGTTPPPSTPPRTPMMVPASAVAGGGSDGSDANKVGATLPPPARLPPPIVPMAPLPMASLPIASPLQLPRLAMQSAPGARTSTGSAPPLATIHAAIGSTTSATPASCCQLARGFVSHANWAAETPFTSSSSAFKPSRATLTRNSDGRFGVSFYSPGDGTIRLEHISGAHDADDDRVRLVAGDIVHSINGIPLETPRESKTDSEEALLRLIAHSGQHVVLHVCRPCATASASTATPLKLWRGAMDGTDDDYMAEAAASARESARELGQCSSARSRPGKLSARGSSTLPLSSRSSSGSARSGARSASFERGDGGHARVVASGNVHALVWPREEKARELEQMSSARSPSAFARSNSSRGSPPVYPATAPAAATTATSTAATSTAAAATAAATTPSSSWWPFGAAADAVAPAEAPAAAAPALMTPRTHARAITDAEVDVEKAKANAAAKAAALAAARAAAAAAASTPSGAVVDSPAVDYGDELHRAAAERWSHSQLDAPQLEEVEVEAEAEAEALAEEGRASPTKIPLEGVVEGRLFGVRVLGSLGVPPPAAAPPAALRPPAAAMTPPASPPKCPAPTPPAHPAAASRASMPAGWVEVPTGNGDVYFWNPSTGEKTWERPRLLPGEKVWERPRAPLLPPDEFPLDPAPPPSSATSAPYGTHAAESAEGPATSPQRTRSSAVLQLAQQRKARGELLLSQKKGSRGGAVSC